MTTEMDWIEKGHPKKQSGGIINASWLRYDAFFRLDFAAPK
jgi:hypothetical protein